MSQATNRTKAVRSRSALAVLLALVAALMLAACGGSDDSVGGGSDSGTEVAKSGPVEGEMTISNWPGYME